ncbi:hypothetical protein LT702_25165 [Pseudomonas syringae pv. syringae]|uniref:hypothetical protein n=1 Tax=Pseudomonas syringae TaxID=317 RepID=UPI00200B054E|nr:hypothetical protein [Pseudomonas syringae]MCK9754876.1 hypothetical protein [Pseudomonas syringae pv. syringae]
MFSAMLNRVIRITTKQMTDGLNREQKLIEWSNSDCVKQKMTSNRRPSLLPDAAAEKPAFLIAVPARTRMTRAISLLCVFKAHRKAVHHNERRTPNSPWSEYSACPPDTQ